jgi:alpha-beta hydrolase superfamily lysophospholipase
VLGGGGAQALVLNSAGYPPMLTERAAAFDIPVLILHGEADDPADGGSPMTAVARARAFEAALRRAGKPVEAVYYPGGRHNGLFADRREYRDKVARAGAFLRATGDRKASRVSP